jgi:hypothetical protein
MASLIRHALKTQGLLLTIRGFFVHPQPVASFSPRRGTREVLAAYLESAGSLGRRRVCACQNEAGA